MNLFAPDSENIPAGFDTQDFKIRPLTINDVVKDYDAVMSCVGHLSRVFSPDDTWPTADLTLEQDLIDLGWHQKEFQNKSSFAYTLMSLDDETCLGCIYVYPCRKVGYDACVYLWVRQSLKDKLDEKLYSGVQEWMQQDWWFSKVAYPGRQQSWEDWMVLPSK